MSDKKEINNRITQLLLTHYGSIESVNWSEAGRMFGCSPPQAKQISVGVQGNFSRPGFDILEKIVQTMNCTSAWLLEGVADDGAEKKGELGIIENLIAEVKELRGQVARIQAKQMISHTDLQKVKSIQSSVVKKIDLQG